MIKRNKVDGKVVLSKNVNLEKAVKELQETLKQQNPNFQPKFKLK